MEIPRSLLESGRGCQAYKLGGNFYYFVCLPPAVDMMIAGPWGNLLVLIWVTVAGVPAWQFTCLANFLVSL